MIQIIYVSSPESQQIYVWKLDNEKYGILKLIQIVCTPGQAQPIVIHPNKKFLYIGVRPNFKIITYSIDHTGLLRYIGNTKIFSSPTYLICDKKGKFLYCASYQCNTISVLPIQISGIVNAPIQIIENLLGCHSIGIDKCRELIWVPCLKEDSIRLFKISMFGTLIQYAPDLIKSSKCNSGPRHIIFHGIDCFAYVINELNSTIDVIDYDYNTYTPNIVQNISIIPMKFIDTIQYWGSDIHITSNSCWLYCADRAVNIISIFNISSNTKKLKFVGYQFTEIQPRGFSIDITGQFLIVAGQKSNYITLYRINANNGMLTMLSRYFSGKGPMWISIFSLN